MTKRIMLAAFCVLLGFPVCVPALAIDDDNISDGFTVYRIVTADDGIKADGDIIDATDWNVTQRKITALKNIVQMHRERLKALEDKVFALQNTSAINPSDTRRIQELERIVQGLQKQVTILHGKKADKPAKKASKQQAIPIVVGDGENVGALTGQHAPHKIWYGDQLGWGPYCDGK